MASDGIVYFDELDDVRLGNRVRAAAAAVSMPAELLFSYDGMASAGEHTLGTVYLINDAAENGYSLPHDLLLECYE